MSAKTGSNPDTEQLNSQATNNGAEQIAEKPAQGGTEQPTLGTDLSVEKKKLLAVITELRLQIEDISKHLTIKEDLMLTKVLKDNISQNYYRRWVGEANKYFRLVVNLSNRLRRLEAKAR